MNPGEDDSEFENQLRGMALRQPPPEWKSLLLPPAAPPPLFTKPLLLGLAVCWAVGLGIYLATPEREDLGPPMLPPPTADPVVMDNALAIRMENE